MPAMILEHLPTDDLIEWATLNLESTIGENILENGDGESSHKKERDNTDLFRIFGNMTRSANAADAAPKSFRRILTGEKIMTNLYVWKLFLAQNARCFYSGIPSGKRRDFWNFFSLERIDNKRGHVEGNVVFICRVFNTQGQRRSSIWHWIQHQTHVPLSDAQLVRCKDEEAKDVTDLLRDLKARIAVVEVSEFALYNLTKVGGVKRKTRD